MTYGDGNYLNVEGAYSFGSNVNTGNGNKMTFGDGNRLSVEGSNSYSFGDNANFSGKKNKINFGNGNKNLNV